MCLNPYRYLKISHGPRLPHRIMSANNSWRSGFSLLKNRLGPKTHLSPASTKRPAPIERPPPTERPTPSIINPSQFEAVEPPPALYTTSLDYNPSDESSYVQGSVGRSTISKVCNPSPIRSAVFPNTMALRHLEPCWTSADYPNTSSKMTLGWVTSPQLPAREHTSPLRNTMQSVECGSVRRRCRCGA